MAHDPQLLRLLSRLQRERAVFVHDDDDPEIELPGVARAIEMGLVHESYGGGFSDGRTYRLAAERSEKGVLIKFLFWVQRLLKLTA